MGKNAKCTSFFKTELHPEGYCMKYNKAIGPGINKECNRSCIGSLANSEAFRNLVQSRKRRVAVLE